MSNLGSIHTYRSEMNQILRYGGGRKETSIHRAVFNLINASARPHRRLLVEQLACFNLRRKQRVTPEAR